MKSLPLKIQPSPEFEKYWNEQRSRILESVRGCIKIVKDPKARQQDREAAGKLIVEFAELASKVDAQRAREINRMQKVLGEARQLRLTVKI